MKSILTTLGMLLLVFSVTFAQTEDKKGDTSAEGPIMDFETTEVDYGTIEQGSDPLRVFKFTNTGKEPLQITHAKGSCGCTVPEWPKEPIFPGETNEIKVRYDTKRIGKFSKRVTLTTNESVGTRVLTIKGEVKKKPEEPAGVPASEDNMFTAPNNG